MLKRGIKIVRIIHISILIVFFICGSCTKKFKGYVEKPSGLFFRLETIEDEEKRIQKNNYLQFKYTFKDYSGKIIDESRTLLKVNNVFPSGGIVEALSLMNQKEKASAIFPMSKLREELDGSFTQNNLHDSVLIYAQLKIDSIYSEEEFLSATMQFKNWLNQIETNEFDVMNEEVLMNQFEDSLKISMEKSVSGLRYIFLKRGKGEEAGYGKRIEVKYTGKFLNGKEFNSTEILPNQCQDFYLGQEMQVIKGIEESLLFMREGDVALLLIPSWIGFGKKGSSTGIVPPLTPTLYKVELNKVN
ncbi:MAG: hypothetical protein CMP67_07215 [Flavobacteriales bacterium]|nr:hypothetical protein [Flavobacteriales bacterium]|tara:strand:- start:1018 stop:1923 length:906 start_codon:yes stop_codon:yes gene_type:complete